MMKKYLQTGCVGTLIALGIFLLTSCATVTNLGLNPNTTTIAEGRAYYRIVSKNDDEWGRLFYTDTPTGKNGVLVPSESLFGSENRIFDTNYPYINMYLEHNGPIEKVDIDLIHNQPKSETGWTRILFAQQHEYSKLFMTSGTFQGIVICEIADGSWELVWLDTTETPYKKPIYITDGKTKLKVWDPKKAENNMYALTWDEAKTLMLLCNSLDAHYEYGLIGNAENKLLDTIIGQFTPIDSFEISHEERMSIIYLSMIYLGANPHATELLFSPEDAKQFWQ